MKSTRKIKWVNSVEGIYKDCPTKVDLKNVGGYYYEPTNTIYLIRKKSDATDKYHEIHHSIHHHSEHPRSPMEYAMRETSADVYAYKKTGKPAHRLAGLIARYNALVKDEYNENPTNTLRYIKRALKKTGAPETWMKDYEELVRRVQKVQNKLKHQPKKT